MPGTGSYAPGNAGAHRRRRLFLSKDKQQNRFLFGTCSGLLRYSLLSFRTCIEQDPKQTKRKPVKRDGCFGSSILPGSTGINCMYGTAMHKEAQAGPFLCNTKQ